MPREIVFGNQSLLVALDNKYMIRDIYFPHVGMENHLNGHKCRIGIWIDGDFTWIENDEWKKEIKYESDTLIGHSIVSNQRLGLRIIIKDAVHLNKNIFIRRLILENLRSKKREIRAFFTQDLQIYETSIGITAYYDPDSDSIVHFLKDRYFMFSGKGIDEKINSFATGKAHFGKEGTYKDAEDGILSENPVDQGSVDSTLQINTTIEPNSQSKIDYWFSVGTFYRETRLLNEYVRETGLDRIFAEIRAYDNAWVNKSKIKFQDLPDEVVELFKRSLLIVKTQTDKDGAIIAANDSDILQFNRDHYSYMWPRDGALVATALDKAGYSTITQRFFKFCAEVISSRGFLLHKYNPNKTPGSTWHPWYTKNEGKMLAIQEDETALVIFSLWKHYERFADLDFVKEIYHQLVIPAADFMCSFRDEHGLPKPSYDLWEERRGVLTFTVSAVYAGLIAAANFAHLFGEESKETKYIQAANEVKEGMKKYLFDKDLNRFLRMINFRKDGSVEKDVIIDASLFGIFEFGVFAPDDSMVISTMEQVLDRLWIKTDVGGVARYENDYYHQISDDIEKVPGNPWFICTLWLAEWYIKLASRSDSAEAAQLMGKAKDLLVWVSDRVLKSGILAEQVHPFNNKPLSVSPLTWSHATFILTVMEYLEENSMLKACPKCGRPMEIFSKFHNHQK